MAWSIGGFVNGGQYLVSALAEYYLMGGTPVDITDPNVKNSFRDPVTGLPRRAGDLPVIFDANGNILSTLHPQIHLWGGPNQWLLNQPNWTRPTWSWTNPPTAMTDGGPNAFYVAAGALSTPVNDPWGFSGEM